MTSQQLPDVRDGLTQKERVVPWVLHETQKERGDRNVPTAMLWGRVCEHFYISPEELTSMLVCLRQRQRRKTNKISRTEVRPTLI